MKRVLPVILISFAIFSCKKNNSDEIRPEDQAKAAELTIFLQGNSFQLKKYYSEKPIDYIDTDQVVKSETELWSYVSVWLHDDAYVFGQDGSLSIQQNLNKFPSNGSETISKKYEVAADKDGVGFKFIGHEYQDLNYRLISFTDTTLKVSASWNNKTVISEYNVLR